MLPQIGSCRSAATLKLRITGLIFMEIKIDRHKIELNYCYSPHIGSCHSAAILETPCNGLDFYVGSMLNTI